MTDSGLLAATLRSLLHDAEVREERETLRTSLFDFVREGWASLKPEEEYVANWHLQVLCAYLEEVSAGNIKRLQIWLPRRSMKSYVTSIMWPAWEWTRNPGINYWTASFSLDLAMELATKSRDLMLSPWYRERWGEVFSLTRVAEQRQENSQGGRRFVTARGSQALGRHGNRILIDDAVNAQDADATSGIRLRETNDWYDAAVPGSLLKDAAIVNIQQRLHESDLAAHLMDLADKTGVHWDILCLPERFEEDHPEVWRGDRIPECIRERFRGTPLENGDPRSEGDLLWPEFRNEAASNEMAISLTSFRAAGQLQQRPAAREGEILLRSWWRFYDPRFRGQADKLPKFSRILVSGDFPSKDKESNDLSAVQLWGVAGADRYLLDLDKGHWNYGKAKRRLLELARYARQTWPKATHQILIENAGFGVELILDLKREITGVQKIVPSPDGDKVIRAETASADLESGNCFLPGYGPPWQPAFDEAASPSDICDFVHSLAVFPNGAHDDDVDAWSQAMNWIRLKQAARPLRTSGLHRIVRPAA